MTQNEQIRNHLKQFGSITPIEALQEYGIMRLASRISDLKKEGFPIASETVKSMNRFGKPVTFSKYRISE